MHDLRQPADDYVSGLQRRQSEKWTHLGIIQFIQLWILSNTHVSVCNNTINYQEEGEEEEGEELSADRSKDAEVGIWLTALWRRRDDPQRSTWGHSVIGNQGNNGEGWYLWDGFIYNKEHVDQQATSVLCHLQMAVTAQLPVCVCVCVVPVLTLSMPHPFHLCNHGNTELQNLLRKQVGGVPLGYRMSALSAIRTVLPHTQKVFCFYYKV